MLKVVITGNGNADPAPLQPHLRSKKRREDLAERFKNPNSGFDLVIVRDTIYIRGWFCRGLVDLQPFAPVPI
jgi:type I site-specific restriction-modification system R (restriction) subunit